ncbi:MAG: D-2-hydroxyacid dehydrogenase [Alteraurantiacibacter sp.]
MKALLPATVRPMLEGRLPSEIEPLWWADGAELVAQAPQAEIGWFDMFDKTAPKQAVAAASGLRWLNTIFSGVDWMPLSNLRQRGVVLTNGSGLTANLVAEFALMMMLAFARDHAAIVRAADRHKWLASVPLVTRELAGSRVLILGYGEIGQAIDRMLQGFRADTVAVRRQPGPGTLGPHEWRAQLHTFDWVVLALPGTPETRGLFDAATLAAMKPDAVLVNMARADVVDQQALVAMLHAGTLGGAICDLTDPEPIPPGHPLWDAPNCHVTMHQAGLPTQNTRLVAADRFVANCARYLAGEPLAAQVDLALGY